MGKQNKEVMKERSRTKARVAREQKIPLCELHWEHGKLWWRSPDGSDSYEVVEAPDLPKEGKTVGQRPNRKSRGRLRF